MESAPARAQSRIPPFRLSKTVQPAPHKGQRRWLPHFSGQSSSADAKNGAKKRVFPKCLLSPRGTRAAGHSVSTHTMLRAALKPPGFLERRERLHRLDTHNAACGIETMVQLAPHALRDGLDTHNAACGIETSWRRSQSPRGRLVSTHTMLRAALKLNILVLINLSQNCLDTHNAACGIETPHLQRIW